jgi:integrase
MLESSCGFNFFLKSPKVKTMQVRYIYLRVTVDGVPKETSTKKKWNLKNWNQDLCRAIGTKEDAKTINYFLDSLTTKINHFIREREALGERLTSTKIIDFVNGINVSKAKVLEEFDEHNKEIYALVPTEYAKGTYERYVTARSHVQEFIVYKYKRKDLEFRELNYEFISDYAFYLKTVRKCSNNTTLKYISNFKKIVLRAIAKDIIPKDPFNSFKGKKTKIKKYPLTSTELALLENKVFESERLTTVRDIFIFQCYTGLAYIDVYQLKKEDIRQGIDGKLWIISKRQKTKSNTDIPLLPKAIEILEKYKSHPTCIKRQSVLPVKSNQKMNEYLQEVADLSGVVTKLNTHKARRTFASTVTLNNGVSMHVVKELLGHQSIKETEKYAITEQESISREMNELNNKLNKKEGSGKNVDLTAMMQKFERDLEALKNRQLAGNEEIFGSVLSDFEQRLTQLKKMFSN